MQENLPSAGGGALKKWAKPAAVVAAVFILGFAVPVLVRNYLSGRETGQTPTPAAPQPAGSYIFDKTSLTLSPGETAKINLSLDTGGEPIEAFDFAASYDPSVVEIASVDATPLFPEYPALEYGNGKLTISGNIGLDNKSFAVNDLLAIITIEGKSKGRTTLSVNKQNSNIASKGENILGKTQNVAITVE